MLTAQLKDELGKGMFLEGYRESEDDVWKLLGQFNFDRRGLTFNFSPYDVLPYVLGSHEVPVPWNFLSDMIPDEYDDILVTLTARG